MLTKQHPSVRHKGSTTGNIQPASSMVGIAGVETATSADGFRNTSNVTRRVGAGVLERDWY